MSTSSSFFADLLAQHQPQFQTHQALIAVGLQNDFCSPSAGKLPVTQPPGLLDRIKRLVPAFREHAGHVIWVRSELDPNKPVDPADDADAIVIGGDDDHQSTEPGPDELPSARPGSRRRQRHRPTDLLRRLQARAREAEEDDADATQEQEQEQEGEEEEELFLTRGAGRQVCVAGSWGADWADDMADVMQRPADTLVTKPRYSALKDTTLLLTLRAKLITELYVCGCISNISVYATAVEAARHGIEIYLVDDCVGFRQPHRHREAIRQMVEYMGAHTISSAALIAQLTGGNKAEDEGDNAAGASTVEDDLEEMLKKFKLERKNTRRSRRPSSPPKQAETASPSVAPEAVAISANPLEAAGSDDALLDETTLLLERHSIRSRPRVEQPLPPSRSSGSVKSKVRVRRKPSQKPQSPPEDKSSSSQQKEGKEVTEASPSFNGAQAGSPSGSKLTRPESSSCEALKSSSSPPPGSGTPPPAEARATISSKSDTAASQSPKPSTSRPPRKKTQSLATLPTLGPSDKIGEGDSRLVLNFLPASLRASAAPERTLEEVIFHKLYNEVRWQTMLHNQGEVPRLVAVQGESLATEDGSLSIPVYRHPSDQSLPLLHFSPAVLRVRKQVEELVGHPVNHVLIQLYRDGQDYISEHSDKTLDIVRGSSIVNVSFGAQRTMRLRTKRSAAAKSSDQAATGSNEASSSSSFSSSSSLRRQTQRVPLPHNSVFVLGPHTNTRWLHGITADKRRPEERSEQEKDFAGMRISLTFRHIGTFLQIANDDSTTTTQTKIWGQGATSKTRADARPVVNGDEKQTESLIRAFGAENQATEFAWEEVYGGGSDVLHFRDPHDGSETPTVYASHSEVENRAVLLYLEELGVAYSVVGPPPVRHSDDFEWRSVCLRDVDAAGTEVCGAVLVLAYLESHYGARASTGRPASSSATAGNGKADGDGAAAAAAVATAEGGEKGASVVDTVDNNRNNNRAAAAAAHAYLSHASHLHRLWAKFLGATSAGAAPQSTFSARSTGPSHNPLASPSQYPASPSATPEVAKEKKEERVEEKQQQQQEEEEEEEEEGSAKSDIPPDLSRALSIDLAALEELRATDRMRRRCNSPSPSLPSSSGDPPATSSAAATTTITPPYLAGTAFSVADCAVWPLIDALRRSGWDGWSEARWPELAAYWRAVGSVRGLIKEGEGATPPISSLSAAVGEGDKDTSSPAAAEGEEEKGKGKA